MARKISLKGDDESRHSEDVKTLHVATKQIADSVVLLNSSTKESNLTFMSFSKNFVGQAIELC